MLVFISSTFKDLVSEREAVQSALFQSEAQPSGMEFFVSSPDKPLDVCLENLRAASAVVLLIGARAGSFVPGSNNLTYTAVEFHEAEKLGLPIFPFILVRDGDPPNDEKDAARHTALERLRAAAQQRTPGYFSNIDQLKFGVVAAFQVWTNKGRPGSRKTFASFEEYFAAYAPALDRPLLFDFTQTLVGRDQQPADLKAFVTSSHSVAVVVGRGGIGKTKLLYALAQAVADQSEVVFLRRGAVWHRESEKELPAGDLLVIADDAHRETDLTKLAQCFSEIRHTHRSVHLILSCRPSGLDAINVALAKMFDPTEVVRLPPLAKLAVENVRQLVHEELGPGADPGIVEWLVSVSWDTPLVTVAAARLIKRQNLHPSEIKSSEDFQRLVFDRFVDELQASNHSFPTRKLIELAAAMGPESFSSDSLIRDIAAYLKVESHEVHQSLQWLQDRGLLIWDERGFRIAPDALADRVLESCCVPNQRASGFAEFVLRRFGSRGNYGQILSNFAEVDWRLRHTSDGRRSILDGIWSELVDKFHHGDASTRCDILGAIKTAAIYEPARSIQVCKIAMTTEAVEGGQWWPRKNSDVLNELPEILGAVSQHNEFAQEAIRMLLELWRNGVRGAYTEAKDQAKLRPVRNQPHRTAEVLDAIETSVGDPTLYGSDDSILDLIDEALKREIEWSRSTESTIELMSYRLPHASFKSLRQRGLDLLEGCLTSNEPKVAMRALQSLMETLDPFLSAFRREVTPDETAWQDEERLIVIDILSRRVLADAVSLPIQQQIFSSLRKRKHNWHSPPVEKALTSLMAKMPDSETFSSFDAFVTPYWSWEPMDRDLSVHQARYSAWIDQCTDRFVACHPTPEEQIARMEGMARLYQDSWINKGASEHFMLSMSRRYPKFVRGFIEYVCNLPFPGLGHEIRVVIAIMRNSDFGEYVRLASRLARHPIPDVALGVGYGINWSDGAGARDGDLEIIEVLAGHPDRGVRLRAWSLAGRAGCQPEFASRAASILSQTDVAHSDLGCDFWFAVGKYGTPVGAFTEDQMRAVLRNVVHNDRLDDGGGNEEEFLENVASRWPHLLAELLTNRLEKAASEESKYSAWGSLDLTKYLQALPGSPLIPAILRRIRDLGLREDVAYNARELFWAIAGDDPIADEVLSEWIADEVAERRALARSWSKHRGYDPPRVYVSRPLDAES